MDIIKAQVTKNVVLKSAPQNSLTCVLATIFQETFPIVNVHYESVPNFKDYKKAKIELKIGRTKIAEVPMTFHQNYVACLFDDGGSVMNLIVEISTEQQEQIKKVAVGIINQEYNN